MSNLENDVEWRIRQQGWRNRDVAIDPRAIRVRELVEEIADARTMNLKVYDNAVNLQKLEIERSVLIAEMRGEVRVVVDNSFVDQV